MKQLEEELEKLEKELRVDLPKDMLAFGSKVFLEDLDTGEELMYELVTPEEVDPRNGKISIASPIGKALLNKEIGDAIEIQLSNREKRIRS